MSKVLITEDTMSSIADAIREKTGKTGGLLPSAMPQEILSISGGGGGGGDNEKQCSVVSFFDENGNPTTFTGSFPKGSKILMLVDSSQSAGNTIGVNKDWFSGNLSAYIGNSFALTNFWKGSLDSGTVEFNPTSLPHLTLRATKGNNIINEDEVPTENCNLLLGADGYFYNDDTVIRIFYHDLKLYSIDYCDTIDDPVLGKFYKIRYTASDYSVKDNKYLIEFYFHESGNVMIYIDNIVTRSTTSEYGNGMTKKENNKFTISKYPFEINDSTKYISMYKTNPFGADWKIDYNIFSLNNLKSYANTVSMSASLEECMDADNLISYVWNSIYDDSDLVIQDYSFIWGDVSDATTVILNGNSYVNINNEKYIYFNGGRDGGDPGMINAKARIQYIADFNNLKCLHLLWQGLNYYGGSSINQQFDVLLFENGDAMIYARQFYDKTKKYLFLDQDYSEYIDATGDYVSFYLQKDGTYNIVKEIYDITKA